jgi:hypothetical protein
MATLLKKYKDINDTLRHIKIQIIDGVDYALDKTPEFKNPEELYNWLLKRVTYINDPKNKELLQTFPTLLNKNFHGVPGGGDCDCFTIATITLMIANDWDNIDIVLAGRSKKCPVHIYCRIKWKGKYYTLDLTNRKFNKERFYPLTQKLPVRWKNWQF